MVTEPRGRAAAFVASPLPAACAVAGFAVLFRLLTFRELTNDHYMHLAWAQQLLFGDLPGRDFVDPGFPLQYAISAAVQWLWPGPFSEALLSIVLLGLAAGCVTLVTGSALRSTAAGVAAGLITVAWLPRLYSHPKVLVPAVTLWLVYRAVRRPGPFETTMLAAWTVAATLLRHDLGVFAALAIAVGLLTAPRVPLTDRLGQIAGYGVATALISLPYLAYVQWTEGVAEHLRVGSEFARTDAHQLMVSLTDWPAFIGLSAAAWLAEPGILLFWLTHLLLAGILVLAAIDVRRGRDSAPVVASAAAFLVCYRLTVLRHSLEARLPDLAAVYAVCVVVVCVAVARFVRAQWGAPWRTRRVVTLTAAAAVLVCVAAGSAAMADIVRLGEQIRRSSLFLGPRAAIGRASSVFERATGDSWDVYWPAGEIPPVIGYLTACTGARDRLLTTWPAPEYHFFARRAFSAGHLAFFHRDAFSSPEDQAAAVERLRRQFVPVVLINKTQHAEFARDFQMVAEYIDAYYEPRGRFVIRDGSDIVIAVRRGLRPRRVFGAEAWPCDFGAPPRVME